MRNEMHCPYCGARFRKEELFTAAQSEYVRQVINREVTPVIADELRRMIRSTLKGPHWSFKESEPNPIPALPDPPVDASADSELQCPDCNIRFQVDGIFGYCPGCLSENLLLYDANLALIKRELSATGVSSRQLRHAYADFVSTFEIFCRKEASRIGIGASGMQNLEVARRSFLTASNVDILGGLSSSEELDLRRVFQKRHVSEHNNGVIDHKYIKVVPEDADLLGSKATLSADELTRSAAALRKAISVLVSAR